MQKVELSATKIQEQLKRRLPCPFNNIEYKRAGQILGKQVRIGNNPLTSTYARLKSKNQKGILERDIPQGRTKTRESYHAIGAR